MSTSKVNHILVYGTLKSNGWNHGLIGTDAELVGVVDLPYTMFSLGSDPHGVPGVDLEEPGHMRAELYAIKPDRIDPLLGRLDRLEGYNPAAPEISMYQRRVVDAGDGINAYIYHYGRQRWAGSQRITEWTPRS